jgi:hypothetical protein
MKERHLQEAERQRLIRLNGEASYSKSEQQKVRYGNLQASDSEIQKWIGTLSGWIGTAAGLAPKARDKYYQVCCTNMHPALHPGFRHMWISTFGDLPRDEGQTDGSRPQENAARRGPAPRETIGDVIQQAREQDQQGKQDYLFDMGGIKWD